MLLRLPLWASMTLFSVWTLGRVPVTMVVILVWVSTVWLPLSLLTVRAVLWGTLSWLVRVSRVAFPLIFVVAILIPLGVFRMVLTLGNVWKWMRVVRVTLTSLKNT